MCSLFPHVTCLVTSTIVAEVTFILLSFARGLGMFPSAIRSFFVNDSVPMYKGDKLESLSDEFSLGVRALS